MKKFGFSRKERLKKTGEIVRVVRGGRKIKGSFLSLSYKEFQTGTVFEAGKPSGSRTVPVALTRLAVIVPKRVFKRAHDRNKMKRWIREAFRLEKNRVKPGFNLVVQLSRAPEKLDFHQVKNELVFLFNKADLIL